MAKIEDAIIPYIQLEEGSAPATPASGIVRVYTKTDGQIYGKDDAGTEYQLAPLLHGAAPAAGSGYRGFLHITEGGAGVADTLEACLKKSDDTYSWLTVGLT